MHVYLNLIQSYEGEFSAATGKKPDADGLFALDTLIGGHVTGILLYEEQAPAGLAAIARKGEGRYEVCEFYIVPCFRKRRLGTRFAHAIWQRYPGRWEIKQIAGAEYATIFWRRAIGDFAGGGFREDVFDDPYWGTVTRQRFTVP
jgi:predicted acetyltransferase